MKDADALKSFCREAGADLVGIADLEILRNSIAVHPDDLLAPFVRAVALGVRLDAGVVDDIRGRPTVAYARHYVAVNAVLDALAGRVSQWISSRCGFSASPVPASRIVDSEHLFGSLSHKAVARLAGLGWQGKSLLIVHPELGPRFRMATVLTDMPLPPDEPIENRCGNCTACTDACPPGAIRNVSTTGHYATRDEAVNMKSCADWCFSFKADPEIGASICGVCVAVCPWGR